MKDLEFASKPKTQEEIMKSMESDNKRLRAEMIVLKRRTLELEKSMSMLDENSVEKIIKSAMDDAKKMHDVYRTTFTKICVATELRYFLRNDLKRQSIVLAGVVKAYDLNEEFWSGLQDTHLNILEPIFFEIGEESGILNERDIAEH